MNESSNFISEWVSNKEYFKGDMVYVFLDSKMIYFICSKKHFSYSDLNPKTLLNKDIYKNTNICENYWVEINIKSINNFVNPTIKPTPIIFTDYSIIKPIKNLKRKVDEIDSFEDDIENSKDELNKQDRKIVNKIDKEISIINKKRNIEGYGIENKIKLLDVDIHTKIFILDKFKNGGGKLGSSDYDKNSKWINTVLNFPFGVIKQAGVKTSSDKKKINDYFQNAKKIFDKNIHGLDNVKNQFIEFMAKRITNPSISGDVLAIEGEPGIGKCFAKDTKILMSNGNIKNVQDIVVGDTLMGDDGDIRRVLSLGRGKDKLYKINHLFNDCDTIADSYTVNSHHILTLICVSRNDKCEVGDIFEIKVKDYINLDDSFKNCFRGYTISPVKFHRREEKLPVNPKILGVFLSYPKDNFLTTAFYEEYYHLFLGKTKIPDAYKYSDYNTRMGLMLGFLRGNGSYVFYFDKTREQLKEDFVFVAKSLGISVYEKDDLITLINNEGIFDICVEELGFDNYYGFCIDGNERFLLGNFIVTHNTKIIKTMAEAMNLPFYQINLGGMSDASILNGHSETYVGSKPGKLVEIMCNAKCLNPIIYLDECDKISDKTGDILSILTHILDKEQNDKFQDNYLSGINIDLSKVLFVISLNDTTKLNKIVLDRMNIVKVPSPDIKTKVQIASQKLIPEIIKKYNISQLKRLEMSEELIEYIISKKTCEEAGVRKLSLSIESLISKINYLILTNEADKVLKYENGSYIITKNFIDSVLSEIIDSDSFPISISGMYI